MFEESIDCLGSWRRRIERLHPFQDSDAQYVDLDGLRGGGISVELNSILLSAASGAKGTVHLLAGGRGTGKSTELRRMARELEQDPRLVVLRVDLGRHGVWERPPMVEEQAAKLALEIREAARIELGGRQLRPSADPQEVVAELVEQVAPGRLVLLVDHFDTMALPAWAVASGYRELADVLLRQHHPFLLPACTTVYVVSDHLVIAEPNVMLAYGESLWFLPAVRVRKDRGSELEEEAVRRLEQVLENWIDLDELFGVDRLEHVRHLVGQSGGNLGVLAQLTAELVREAEDCWLPVGDLAFRDAAARVRSRMASFSDCSDLLRRVRKSGGLELVSRAETSLFVEAMHQGAIQTYWGGWGGETLWQDVHPLVNGG